MRKKAVLCRRELPDGNMSGRVASSSFLSLPALSGRIPQTINNHDGDALALEVLALLSNCIDVSRQPRNMYASFVPPETPDRLLTECLLDWINQGGYSSLSQLDVNVSVYHPSCAETTFENIYYGRDDDPKPLLHICIGGDNDQQYNVSYLRENQAIGAAILDLFDKSPVYILSPARLMEGVSWMYWGGDADEKERIEDLREEQGETVDEDIAQFVPITRNDFDVAFPDWTMKEPARKVRLPEQAERLKQANAKYSDLVRKYEFHPVSCDMATLPGITLTGLADEPLAAEGILTKWWDDVLEDAYNSGHNLSMSPFALFVDPSGGYNEARRVLSIVRAYLDCMDAAVELMSWLEMEAKQQIKVKI